LGCGDGRETAAVRLPTLVAVDPEDFLGPVPCSDAPGAMQRYVATFIDVTPEAADAEPIGEFTLPSSRPVDCLQRVGSSLVVPGHKYVAEIDAYDRIDLQPLGPGSRTIVDGSGTFVAPRWTTTCGRVPSSPVSSVSNVTRLVRDCQPLQDSAPLDLVGVWVTVDPTVVGLTCGAGAGEVSQFSVENLLTGERQSGPCGQPVEFAGLQSGTTYEFAVLGFEAGSSAATWSTLCVATAQHGTIVRASCDPLGSSGAEPAQPDSGAGADSTDGSSNGNADSGLAGDVGSP
jgi:hypothetical protein